MNLLPIILLFTLALLSLFFFFLYPLFLLIKSLFDREMDIGAKLLMLGGSLFTFPIPSYIYSGFIKDGGFGKFMVVLNIILILVMVGGAFIILGPQGVSDLYRKAQSGQFNTLIEQIAGLEPVSPAQLQAAISAPVQKPQEDSYSGVNTYGVDETNVFGAGESAQKVQTQRPLPSAPQPPAAADMNDPFFKTVYESCMDNVGLKHPQTFREKFCACTAGRMKPGDTKKTAVEQAAFCMTQHTDDLLQDD